MHLDLKLSHAELSSNFWINMNGVKLLYSLIWWIIGGERWVWCYFMLYQASPDRQYFCFWWGNIGSFRFWWRLITFQPQCASESTFCNKGIQICNYKLPRMQLNKCCVSICANCLTLNYLDSNTHKIALWDLNLLTEASTPGKNRVEPLL